MISKRFNSPLRVAVLAGGESAERDVSLQSGAAVAAALAVAGHSVTLLDPADCPLSDVDWTALDAAFIALHGGAGEDGRVQEELEQRGIPYTGSTSQACRLAMSKSASKERFRECGVPTPPYALVEPGKSAADVARELARFNYPLIVKPDGQGSSIGISVAQSNDELARSIALAREYDHCSIVEPFIVGREFTLAMLDDRALPLLEIVSPERVFSYEAKYQSSLTEYRFDFRVPATARSEILHAAVAAAKALGTAGLARVDVMLSREGQVFVLEVNTVPGMTPRSLAPRAADRAGLDMTTLCDLLVRQCHATSGVS
jgi:D-alanine-D-alanine ligase